MSTASSAQDRVDLFCDFGEGAGVDWTTAYAGTGFIRVYFTVMGWYNRTHDDDPISCEDIFGCDGATYMDPDPAYAYDYAEIWWDSLAFFTAGACL